MKLLSEVFHYTLSVLLNLIAPATLGGRVEKKRKERYLEEMVGWAEEDRRGRVGEASQGTGGRNQDMNSLQLAVCVCVCV